MNTEKPMSVLHDIFAWSIGRPAWQCDALRRLITKENLDEVDRTELEILCRKTPGVVGGDGNNLVAMPLAQEHLPMGPDGQDSVCIEYLDSLVGVNRLPSGQKITFGQSPGLTIIYGDNGTGKSGYVRVIKKACRTRGALPIIRPDAFTVATQKPTCKIGIKAGTVSSEVVWTDGVASDERLSNVFVFDSATAGHYLEADGPTSFTPYGLDILPKLSKLCDAIAARIKQDVAALGREIETGKIALNKHANTTIGNALATIAAKASVTNLMLLGGLTETEVKRLAELRALLSSDPKKKARETRAAKSRIENFKTQLEQNASLLSAVKIKELKESFENTVATEQAAKTSVNGSFSGEVLAGTGGDLWRAMWEAAKIFSIKSAYPESPFPRTGNDDRCILCQRPFAGDTTAVELANSFVKFCNADVQKAAKLSREKLTEKTKLFNSKIVLKPEYDKITTDLSALSPVEMKVLTDFIAVADDCLATVKHSIEADKWTPPVELVAAPISILTNAIEVLEKRAKTEESANDPITRQKLQNECNELVAKEWLPTVKADVEKQIERYKQIDVLNESLNETKTNSITSKSSSLTKQLVTDVYCQRFTDEIKELGVRIVDVRLEETAGTKGEKRFGICLVGANGGTVIHEILSEGEQRCVALAGFLAELSQASHQSALVFDDPVSSLDHFYRSRIATRLVKEAGLRQVIVFTHDTVFLNDLLSEASEAKLSCATFYLRWDAKNPGWVETGLPWDCKSPEDRLDKLEKAERALDKIWQPIPDDKLKAEMRAIYGDLRATIERVIEKVIFGDVVFRFRSYVNVKSLNHVVGFSDAENKEVQRLFKKCSDVIAAHDAAAGKQAPVPDTKELAQDIKATKSLLEAIRVRHKAAAKSPAP